MLHELFITHRTMEQLFSLVHKHSVGFCLVAFVSTVLLALSAL